MVQLNHVYNNNYNKTIIKVTIMSFTLQYKTYLLHYTVGFLNMNNSGHCFIP